MTPDQGKTALAALLEEKTDAEARATDLTQAIINIGARLKINMHKATEAFRAVAKSAGATTKEDLEEIHAAFNACAALAATNGIAEALVASVTTTAAERQSALVFTKENDTAAEKRIKAVELQSERGIVTALVEKEDPETTSDERHRNVQAFEALSRGRIRGVEHEEGRLRGEIGVARATEVAARDDVQAARSEVLTLRSAMKGSDREHLTFQERLETRLDSLKRAVEMEERENGAKAAITCLLYERDQAQARVADVEVQLLAQTREANLATFDGVGSSKTELDPRERRDAKILSSGAIRATATGVAETGEGRSFDGSVKNRAGKVERAIWNIEERLLYGKRGETEKRKREEVHPSETTGMRDSEGEFVELDPTGPAAQHQARRPNVSADEVCKMDRHGAALADYKDLRGSPRGRADEATTPREGQEPGNDESMAASLCRGKVAARLEGLRASVVEEEEEAGLQAAMVALLDEKFRAESRANDLEWQLLQVLDAVGAAGFEGIDPGRMPSSSPLMPKGAILAAANAVGARFAEIATGPNPFHGVFEPTKHLKTPSTKAQGRHQEVHQEVPISDVVELAHKIDNRIQDVPEFSGEEIPPAGIFASESQEDGHKGQEEPRQLKFYESLDGEGTPAGVVELLAERDKLPREKERLRLETDGVSLARKREGSLGVGRNELMLEITRDDREETRKQAPDSGRTNIKAIRHLASWNLLTNGDEDGSGGSTIPSPGMSPEQSPPGRGLRDPLHGQGGPTPRWTQ